MSRKYAEPQRDKSAGATTVNSRRNALLCVTLWTSVWIIGCGVPSAPKQVAALPRANAALPSSTPPTAPRPSTAAPRPPTAAPVIRVPAQDQMPQLPNGCEVTSLSMLLTAVGHPVSRFTLAKDQPRDPTPLVESANGTIISWGNPNVGFVGSPYDRWAGYGIYHGPITKLLNEILPGRALDLTRKPFADVLDEVAHGTPVVLWTTATFEPVDDWITWQTPEGPIRVTLQEHAVLLVGYDATHLFINNPLTGQQAQEVNRSEFIAAWHQLGDQAVTVSAN